MQLSDFENETVDQHFYMQAELRLNSSNPDQTKIFRIARKPEGPKREKSVLIASILKGSNLYTFNTRKSKKGTLVANLESKFEKTESVALAASAKIIESSYSTEDLYRLIALKLFNIFRNPYNIKLTNDLISDDSFEPIRNNPENREFQRILAAGNYDKFPENLKIDKAYTNTRKIWLEKIFTLATEATEGKWQRTESLAKYLFEHLFCAVNTYRYDTHIAAICDKGYVDLSDSENEIIAFAFNINRNTIIELKKLPIKNPSKTLYKYHLSNNLDFLEVYNETAYEQCHERVYACSNNLLGVTI